MKNINMYKEKCEPYVDKVENLFSFMMDRVYSFDMFDFAVFKVCLFGFGALMGTYFSKLFKKIAPIVGIVTAVTWIYLIWKIFISDDE